MNILALEPYYGGSHRAFMDGLIGHSRHKWQLLTLPAHKWKWRMRHAAIHFARDRQALVEASERYDLLFCTDMLNLAEFVGLAPPGIASLTKVMYFHENQLTYPVRVPDERDYQFAMTNLTSGLAADCVWFNSDFHRVSFLTALEHFLKSMPDFQPMDAVEKIRGKSSVYPPGIFGLSPRAGRRRGPLRILWSARWEHDKNPEDFFEALKLLKASGSEFKVSVIGQSFRDRPRIFDWAKDYFDERIEHWGYQQTRTDYEQVLLDADVVVSTAKHEFFGIGVVEAIAAGAYPVLPRRLSYPEILAPCGRKAAEEFFYDATCEGLAQKLTRLAGRIQQGPLWPKGISPALLTDRFTWPNLAPRYDLAIEQMEQGRTARADRP
jgi:glycosyltransferase involved in cell wall biosynthesis